MALRPSLARLGAAVVGAALVIILAHPSAADHSEFTSYDELLIHAAGWEATGARVTIRASSTQGRDIIEVAVGTGPFTILSTNLLHANEPSGTEQFVRLVWALLGELEPSLEGDVWPGIAARPPIFDALADDAIRAELLSRVTVVGFAMLDPDGAENAHTRDPLTNLDYSARLTPTTAAWKAALDVHHPDLLLDAHGGPDAPLSIGLVEPIGTEPAVIAASRAAAATAWRAAAAVDGEPRYFEEQPLSHFLGIEGDPAASVDATYYGALTRGIPLTIESLQLEGLPAVYTETVGLQSQDPQTSIIAGASLQQNLTAALAFEGAGMLTRERPGKAVATSDTGELTSTVTLPAGATRLFSTVHWEWFDPAQDWTLELVDATGEVVAAADTATTVPYRRSRAIAVGALAPGEYAVRAVQSGGVPLQPATLRTLWYVEDPDATPVPGLLDGDADVRLCLPSETVYDTLVTALPQTSGLASPSCEDGTPVPAADLDPAAAATVEPAPDPASPGPVTPGTGSPTGAAGGASSGGATPATGAGLGVLGLAAALAAARRRRSR